MAKKLIREGDHAFREEPDEEGKKGLAYERRGTPFWFQVRDVRLFASSVAADEFEKGSEEERTRQAVQGTLEPTHRRDFGFISEDGAELFSGEPLRLDINPSEDEGGTVWFYDKDEDDTVLRRGFYFSAYVSRSRLRWLWNELQSRPGAEFSVKIEVPAYQWEVDAFLAEPWMRQEFFFLKGQRTEIESVSLYVNDPQPPKPTEQEIPAQSEYFGSIDDEKPTAEPELQSEQALLLRRLVRGVGWLIALQVLGLVTMCAMAAERGSF